MRSSVDKQARYRPIQYPLVTAYGTGDPCTTENSLIITAGTKRLHLICCVIKFPGISGYYSAEKIGGFTTMAWAEKKNLVKWEYVLCGDL